MSNKFLIELGKCYSLTTDGHTVSFKVRSWDGSDYTETLDGKSITLHDLTKGGLSSDYDLVIIEY